MGDQPLDKIERRVLANQYAILEKLDPDNAAFYAKNQKILEEGYSMFYSEVLPSDEVKYNRCQYVTDILNLYRALDRSYNELDDKSGIDPDDIRFDGFDGNNESDLLSFAEFLKEEGRFKESLKGDLNSHSMTEHRYDRMLDRFKAISQKHDVAAQWDLSKDEIKQIIAIP